MQLYALYKYLTVSHAPNTSCPSIFDMTGRAKWQAWEKASKEWEGKPDSEAEGRYLEIVRQFGWTGEPQMGMSHTAANSETDSKPGLTSSEEETEEGSTGGTALGMGVSVSQIARPPQEHLRASEDSLHGAVLENDQNAEKLETYIDSHPGINLDEKDEYVSSSFEAVLSVFPSFRSMESWKVFFPLNGAFHEAIR